MNTRTILLALLSLSMLASWQSAKIMTHYEKALKYYEQKRYYRALTLLEEVLPELYGRTEKADALFYQGYCMYHLQRYAQSASVFEDFQNIFYGDPRIEEALYMQGMASSYIVHDYRLDPQPMEDSIQILESYLQQYPKGKYTTQVQEQKTTMRKQLARKALSAATLYYNIRKFRAALSVLNDIDRDFPENYYGEECAFLKLQAEEKLFNKQQCAASKQRVLEACRCFLNDYPASQQAEYVEKLQASTQKN